MIGKMLAHYVITSRLGKGGMGEVYQAKDQKLGRDVAIKVLPEEFARDADRVARFQREAKLLASLNHPNIAAIHGLEEDKGTNFLVLELVEGDTLADRIKAGPIPVEESLKLALQIAEAIEAAHEKGVIHRDLKPANIKVTPDGKVKVLDFGLAKAFAGEQAELNLSNSPTLSDAATQQGVILGTAAYMSPEQAKGKAVDKRADIWAFGVVFFEMLTGRQVFAGETVSDTLASILAREPKWQSLPSNLHPRIRLLLERCLKKEPKDRYGVINDARVDIQEVLADPSGVLVQPVAGVGPRRKLRTILPWVAAALVLGLIIAGVAVWRLKPPEPRQVMRFDCDVPDGQIFGNLVWQSNLAIAPDGKQFVYSTTKGLYLRSMDELTAKLIPGSDGATSQPFFSPDGKWIGYFCNSDRQLKKISINGGAPVTLCSVSTLMLGASWSTDNAIVYGQVPGDIMLVSANGGTPQSLIKTRSASSLFPHILPDGKSVLYTDSASPTQLRVMVKSIESGQPRELFAGAAFGYLPTGHIVYGLPDSNTLFAIPFDLHTMEVKGGPVPMIEGVMGHGTQCAVSDSGTLIYLAGTSGVGADQLTLVWVDRNGKEEPITSGSGYLFPRISPDGTKVALRALTAANPDIWIWDLARKTMTRLTFDEASDVMSLWTPDGKRVAFRSDRGGKPSIYWKAADGTGADELLVSALGTNIGPRSWSADGKTLIFMDFTGTKTDVGAMSIEGDRAKKSLLSDKYNKVDPEISPDGRWMAYSSDESGRFEIYLRPYPEVNGGKWQVSTSGGDWPIWSRDGRELFYRSGDAFMAVLVKTKPTISLETPKTMFRGTYAFSGTASIGNWDVSPDGKRFLVIKSPGSAGAGGGPRKINIAVNWFEELKQRVPTGK
jgi:serine/threonine-protein kinase